MCVAAAFPLLSLGLETVSLPVVRALETPRFKHLAELSLSFAEPMTVAALIDFFKSLAVSLPTFRSLLTLNYSGPGVETVTRGRANQSSHMASACAHQFDPFYGD